MNFTDPRSPFVNSRRLKPSRLRSPRILLAGAGVLLLAGIFAYGSLPTGGEVQRGAGVRNQIAPPVRVASAEIGSIPVTTSTIGTVLANATVSVKSQIEGELLSAEFQEGQLVKRGDVLFRIDPLPAQAELRRAEAQLARTRAQLASAQSDADRATTLAERGIVSTQQRDQMIADARALSASEAADTAALERARLAVGYTTITSPIDGKTGPILIHPGNLVRANSDDLVIINQIQPVRISFALPQSQLSALQDRIRDDTLRASIAVHTETTGAEAMQSESDIVVGVDFIGNNVDERTGTIELRATFDNPDLRLVPGELVDVSVERDVLRDVTMVPRAAVNIGQDGDTYIFVVDGDDRADMRPAQIRYQDENFAVVGDVVRPGERVIVDGQLRVTPGIAVDIIDASKASFAGSGQ
jgi:multidrug efflux system membrane fusion protein